MELIAATSAREREQRQRISILVHAVRIAYTHTHLLLRGSCAIRWCVALCCCCSLLEKLLSLRVKRLLAITADVCSVSLLFALLSLLILLVQLEVLLEQWRCAAHLRLCVWSRGCGACKLSQDLSHRLRDIALEMRQESHRRLYSLSFMHARLYFWID